MIYNRVSICIVTFNSSEYIDKCIKSLLNSNYKNYEIVIFDNCSSDDTVEKIKKIKTKKIKILTNQENIGYAAGVNFASIKASGEYLFILNPDTIVDKECISKMVLSLKNKKIDIIQPLVYLFDKKTINLTGKKTHYLGFDWIDNYGMKIIPKNKLINSISGCGFLIRKKTFELLGRYDSLYFMYYEDSDLSWKSNLLNIKMYYNNSSFLMHDYKYIPKEKYQALNQKIYYIERNRLITLLKNLEFKTFLLLLPILIFVEFSLIFLSLFGGWFTHKISTYYSIIVNYKQIVRQRKFIQKRRVINDRELFEHFADTLEFEKFRNKFVDILINPLLKIYFSIIKHFI